MIFVVSPFAAAGFRGSHTASEVVLFAFAALVVMVSRGRIATAIAIFAAIFSLAGSLLDWLAPSIPTKMLVHIGSVSASIVVSYVVGRAVFAPGVITGHRVRGAIVLYLNLGMMFATGYRLLWDLNPASLSGIPTPIGTLQATHTIFYFSFVTLTSIGGDIVPVHPFARSLVNLESVIGQLYPATLLARLVTLQLQSGVGDPHFYGGKSVAKVKRANGVRVVASSRN
jgi:hypothetical protein